MRAMGTSLVVQWLRICLVMKIEEKEERERENLPCNSGDVVSISGCGTKILTCRGATKPAPHNGREACVSQ